MTENRRRILKYVESAFHAGEGDISEGNPHAAIEMALELLADDSQTKGE